MNTPATTRDTWGGQFCIVPARAMRDTRMTARLLQLLCILSSHTNTKKDGWCSLKLATIRLDYGDTTLTAIRKGIRKLEALGYVESYHEMRGDQILSNWYRILYDASLPAVRDRSQLDAARTSEGSGVRTSEGSGVRTSEGSGADIRNMKGSEKGSEKGSQNGTRDTTHEINLDEIWERARRLLTEAGNKGGWPVATWIDGGRLDRLADTIQIRARSHLAARQIRNRYTGLIARAFTEIAGRRYDRSDVVIVSDCD